MLNLGLLFGYSAVVSQALQKAYLTPPLKFFFFWHYFLSSIVSQLEASSPFFTELFLSVVFYMSCVTFPNDPCTICDFSILVQTLFYLALGDWNSFDIETAVGTHTFVPPFLWEAVLHRSCVCLYKLHLTEADCVRPMLSPRGVRVVMRENRSLINIHRQCTTSTWAWAGMCEMYEDLSWKLAGRDGRLR